MPLHQILLFDHTDQIQQDLRPSDSKGWNDHIPSTVQCFLDDRRQLCHIILACLMQAVSIGRFNHYKVCFFRFFRISDQWTIDISHITGEQKLAGLLSFLDRNQNAG